MHFNIEPDSMFNSQSIEEYSDIGTGNGMSSSPEAGRMLQGGQESQEHYHQLQQSQQQQQQQQQQDFKNHRNARKIDGPVIPTEYSDPDLQRQSSEFSAILQQATSNVSAKRHESTFVMDISPSVVGWIIGRSGIRIKEIQSYTGCKMWVDQDVPNDQPRKIYFHGNKQNIDAAVGRVNELVQAAPILSSNHVVSGKGLTSVIVDCPVSLVGLLIGKRGWTIKKIQQASNAQISINQSVREGLPRKIIVSGDEQSVSTALKLITEVLRDKTLLGSGGGGGEQLTMRMVSGNGYTPRDAGSMPMSMPMHVPMRETSPSMSGYEQGQGQGQGQSQSFSPQQHHFARSRGSNSPSSSDMDPLNHHRESGAHLQHSHGQGQGQSHPSSHSYHHGHHQHHSYQNHSHGHSQGGGGYQHQHGQGQGQGQGGHHGGQSRRGGYHGNNNQHQQHQHQHQQQQHHGPYGGYQESASRLLLNQHGQNNQHHQHQHQQPQHTIPVPVRSINYNSNISSQYEGGGAHENGYQYSDEAPHHQKQQQQSMSGSAELNQFQREASPDHPDPCSVEITPSGDPSSSSSSIFDFQHRNSPSLGGQSEPEGPQQQQLQQQHEGRILQN